MNNRLLLISLMLLVGLKSYAQSPIATEDPNDTWEIRWNVSDEFNDATPNWSKWIQSGGSLPNTTAWLWDNDNNVQISNGVAELTMRHNEDNIPDNNTYFKSGILKSYNTFTTGYFEARIKGAAIGEGVCPAFWLYSDFDYSVSDGEAVYSEIDIVELQQFDWYDGHQDDIQDIDLNLHAVVMENGSGVWRRPKAYPDTQLNKWRAEWDPSEDYHVYGCEVNEEEIIWYVDGEEVARKPNTYWYRPMNVTLSLGLRKPFVQFFDNRNNAIDPLTDADATAKLADMPTTMFVDYVRVWEKTNVEPEDTVAIGELGNLDFEHEDGGLHFWDASAGTQNVVTDEVYSGTNAVQVSNGNVAQIITLKKGTTYTLSSYGKVADGTASAFMGVSESPSNTLVLNQQYTTTTYTKGEFSFTTPDGATPEDTVADYRVWFWSGGVAYVDNFGFYEGEPGDTVHVTSVTLNVETLDITEDETGTLTATVAPANATDKSIVWSSSNESVATVSNGVVTAVGVGSATITVTTNEGDFTDDVTVTVSESTNLFQNPGLEDADLSDWIRTGTSSVTSVSVYSGSNAAFVDGNGSFEQIFSLEPNTTYIASCYAHVGAAGQNIFLGVRNQTTSTFIKNTSITSTSYAKYSLSFTTGDEAHDYKIFFWSNGGGDYYADDFFLEAESNETEWDGSGWSNGTPNDGLDIVINDTTGLDADLECRNLTIKSGKRLRIPSGRTITIKGNLVNNGLGFTGAGKLKFDANGNTLEISSAFQAGGVIEVATGTTLKTNGNLVLVDGGVLLHESGDDIDGTVVAQRQGDDNQYTYNFWSVPVQETSQVSEIGGNNRYIFNESLSQWESAPATLSAGVGMIATGAGLVEFTGTPYVDNVVVPVTYSGSLASYKGFNLIGNPFMAPVDYSAFVTTNTNIENGSLYFYEGNAQGTGNYHTVNGVSPSNIPTFQGFFVRVLGAGNIEFLHSHKANTGNDAFMRKATTEIAHQLQLSLSTARYTDQLTLVLGKDFSTIADDYGYDAKKMFGTQPLSIGWKKEEVYSILALAKDQHFLLPLDIQMEEGEVASMQIATESILDQYQIKLLNLTTGEEVALDGNKVKVVAGNRYALELENKTQVLGVSQGQFPIEAFVTTTGVSIHNGAVGSTAQLMVSDLTGRVIHKEAKVFSTKGVWYSDCTLPTNQLLIISVASGDQILLKKVFLK